MLTRGGGASSKGASEHAQAMATRGGGASSKGASEHELALASTNVGLPGLAINGPNFEKNHGKKVRQVFAALLGGSTKCAGLRCCELGNVDNPCSEEGKEKINQCIIQAFEDAGAAEHKKKKAGQPYNKMVLQSTESPPQIYWYSTCVAAFVPQLQVQVLDPIEDMPRVDRWRCAQRFLLRMGDDNNDGWLLVYNTHTSLLATITTSKKNQRIDFCKAIVRASNDYAKTEKNLIGFALGGDAKCNIAQWSTAMY